MMTFFSLKAGKAYQGNKPGHMGPEQPDSFKEVYKIVTTGLLGTMCIKIKHVGFLKIWTMWFLVRVLGDPQENFETLILM